MNNAAKEKNPGTLSHNISTRCYLRPWQLHVHNSHFPHKCYFHKCAIPSQPTPYSQCPYRCISSLFIPNCPHPFPTPFSPLIWYNHTLQGHRPLCDIFFLLKCMGNCYHCYCKIWKMSLTFGGEQKHCLSCWWWSQQCVTVSIVVLQHPGKGWRDI